MIDGDAIQRLAVQALNISLMFSVGLEIQPSKLRMAARRWRTLLGITAGVVGTFMLLRKRALVGDVVGHSALPGIAVAFLVMEGISPGTGKSLPGLLTGAFVFGLAGAVSVMLIGRYSRIKPDAAMAMTLSVIYGLGAALFTVVQKVPGGNAAGLNTFLNGKTASLVTDDVWLFAGAAVVALTLDRQIVV